MDECILCKKIKPLSDSHIIPRSFFQKVKKGAPQLVKLNSDLSVPPKMDNANWNQPLLCAECEHFLNVTYEGSQLAFLRNYKSVTKSHEKLTYRNLNFTKFYLMWLSILWRASKSKLREFETVNLGAEINELIRQAINGETTVMSGVDISDIIKIGLTRILPESGMNENIVKQMLTSPILEQSPAGFNFYFMIEGFLVFYIFSPYYEHITPKYFGEIKKSRFLRIPRIAIHKSTHATKLFNQMIAIAKTYPQWRESRIN